MADIFEIEMLPGREGDCLMLTWGEGPRLHRMLIDGGRAQTCPDIKRRVAVLPEAERQFELFIISHVDRDHIEGALALLEDPAMPLGFRDVWFNGYHHLLDPEAEVFGPVQGERVTTALLNRKLPWNKHFGGKAVVTDGERPRSVTLEGDMKLTVLSPNAKKLAAMEPVWKEACKDAGLIPGVAARREEAEEEGWEFFGSINIKQLAEQPFAPDRSEPNGTSIAVLAEYKNKRVLLAADAHPDLVEASLAALAKPGEKLFLDAIKVAHHGSQHNTSSRLMDLTSCSKFLISTNGAIHHLPNPVAMSRLIYFGDENKEFIFNYKSDETDLWNNATWKQKYKYQTRYPELEPGTIALIL